MINKQQRRTSCGPTAAYNALQWLGHKVPFHELYNLATKEGYYRPSHGMSFKAIKYLLIKLQVKLIVKHHVRLQDIDKELQKGNSVILQYLTATSGHFVFIDKKTTKYYKIWNYCTYNKTPYTARKSIANWIRYSHRHGCLTPSMIVLRRTNV
jgi:hypothetical protein